MWSRREVVAICVGLVVGLVAIPAAAVAKRVALVVGIDRYDNLSETRQLQRAVSDARSVAATLGELGFELVGGTAAENVSRGQFNQLWQLLLDGVGKDDTVAVYFAGHGVEIEGLNYLLPRDMPAISWGRQEQVKRESLSVAEFLLDLRKRGPQVSFVILDACREHPLVPAGERSAGKRGGLAKMDAPVGTFVLYAAGAGQTALDRLPGDDRDANSVFTRKLLPLLKSKGLALTDLARRLRAEVHALASTVPHTQTPAYYDGVLGDFCVAGCDGASRGEPAVATAPTARPTGAAPATAASSEDRAVSAAEADAKAMHDTFLPELSEDAEKAYLTIEESNDASVLESFIAKYGETFYGQVAKSRLDMVKRAKTAKLDAGPPASLSEPTGNTSINGTWRGHAVTDDGKHPVRVQFMQSGGALTGTVVLSLPDGGKAASYTIKGAVEGRKVSFYGQKFIERHAPNWCLPSVTLEQDHEWRGQLSGSWGSARGAQGCPAGVGGELVLRPE